MLEPSPITRCLLASLHTTRIVRDCVTAGVLPRVPLITAVRSQTRSCLPLKPKPSSSAIYFAYDQRGCTHSLTGPCLMYHQVSPLVRSKYVMLLCSHPSTRLQPFDLITSQASRGVSIRNPSVLRSSKSRSALASPSGTILLFLLRRTCSPPDCA